MSNPQLGSGWPQDETPPEANYSPFYPQVAQKERALAAPSP